LVIGVGQEKGEYFLASDATPIVEYTKDVVYLKDSEIAIIEKGELHIKTVHNVPKNTYIEKLELNLEQIEKGGFKDRDFGSVGVHKKQALILVNYGGAKQSDVLALAQKIKEEVKDRFNISLEEEVNII
jgi:UDP-N-acetylenolpyruvoylglucosamine reductase